MQKKQKLFDRDVDLSLTQQQKNQKINLKLLKVFLKYYKMVWFDVLIAILSMVVVAALTVVMTIFGGNLLSSFSDGFVFKQCIKCGLLVLIIGVLIAVFNWICKVYCQKCNFSIYILMKKDILERINSLDQKCLDQIDALKFLERIDWDGNNSIKKLFNLANIFINMVGGLAFLSYTFYLNIWVGLFLFCYILSYALIKFCHNHSRQKNRMAIKSYAYKFNHIQVDNIRGMKDLRGLDANSSILELEEKTTKHRWSMNYKNTKIDEGFSFGANIVIAIYNFIFVLLCAHLIYKGQLFIAGFMIAYNYKDDILLRASEIATFKDELNECLLSARWINQLFNEDLYPTEKFGDKVLTEIEGKIEFKNVSFRYLERVPVLKDVSFKIEPNTLVSIVGESGGGKSTIIALMNKLYTIKQGKILLDDNNINELTKESIRSNICVVTQDFYLFEMSISDNLRLAKPQATDEEIVDVLKKVKMYNFVSNLDDGINTKLGENGIRLSEGQKQRLSIARALLKDSKIIVFDESTSSLDNENLAKIKKIIVGLKKNHTIILVTHNLSDFENCDNILFVKDGTIFAEGTHENLLENCEEYKRLYYSEITEE